MGNRRNRKRQRQAEQRQPARLGPGFEPFEDQFDTDSEDALQLALELSGRGNGRAAVCCGACREFVEDYEGGRGTCLHPGSGILSPWTDTPGCPFFARGRR